MKTLVIGGSGLVSTAVTKQLVARGDETHILNRGKTPVRVEGNFRRIVADRTDLPVFESAVRDNGPWDCVIDMICSNPEHAESLARTAAGVAGQVIFCSTTNVYPKPADHYPVAPDHRTGAAYKNGIDKAECERIHRGVADSGAYALTIIRPGQCIGEGGGVLNSFAAGTSFLDRIRKGKPIIVHGDGNGLWSGLHVDDVAFPFAASAGNEIAYGKIYNACGEAWFTWDQYNTSIAEALGCECPRLVHVPAEALVRLAPDRAGHVERSLQYPGIYDTTATREELGWRQRFSLVESMQRVIRWIEEHDGIDSWESDPEYDKVIERWEKALDAL